MSQLFVRTAGKQGQRAESVKIIPYERTNSLIVFASKPNIKKVSDLLAKIDTEAPKGTGKIQVYYLQHASAEEMVKVLDQPAGEPACIHRSGRHRQGAADLQGRKDHGRCRDQFPDHNRSAG